jgi:hypothetical protein
MPNWMNVHLRVVVAALVMGVLISASGCFRQKKATERPPSAFTVRSPSGNTNVAMTPLLSPVGRIFSVNTQAQFVVVTFPVGDLPQNNARFSIFRGGTKVGDIKITIPPAPVGNGVSADIVAGTAQDGDEVRAE